MHMALCLAVGQPDGRPNAIPHPPFRPPPHVGWSSVGRVNSSAFFHTIIMTHPLLFWTASRLTIALPASAAFERSRTAATAAVAASTAAIAPSTAAMFFLFQNIFWDYTRSHTDHEVLSRKPIYNSKKKLRDLKQSIIVRMSQDTALQFVTVIVPENKISTL